MKKIILFVFLITQFLFAQQPYVLLISFDGFRYDYLDRNLTPALNQIEKEGVRACSFEPVFPSKTFPNHLSIITGMYAENHGIISNTILNPNSGRKYSLGNRKEVQSIDWYLGEPFWMTAERNGIKTASFFWPSSTVKDKHYSPSHSIEFDSSIKYETRVDSVFDWFELPYAERPHFVTLYFCLTDTYGHKFGPNSDSLNWAISQMNKTTEYLITKLENSPIKDSLNLVFVSDHGMTEISKDRLINIDDILIDEDYSTQNSGTFMFIDTKKSNQGAIFKKLEENKNHYQVYYKEELPSYFHYSQHPFISDIVLVANLGWSLVNNKSINNYKDEYSKGNHGYDNRNIEMHGIFLAKGPAFKIGYKTGTVKNIDVYPLLCKIFNIAPRSNIDGKLEKIEHVLKLN